MKKNIKTCLSVMLGLLSLLALNENLNAIWLNAVGMSRYLQLHGSEGDSNTMAVTRPLLLNGGVRSMATTGNSM